MHTVRMNEVLIRRAAASEHASLAALRWMWIVEEAGGEPIGTQSAFERDFVAWAQQNAHTHHAFVAESGGELIGMAWLALVPRVPSPRAPVRNTGDVQSVYVVPAHRGAGVGARLIDSVRDAAEASGAERVTVHSSLRARSAYARAGFTVESRLMLLEFGS